MNNNKLITRVLLLTLIIQFACSASAQDKKDDRVAFELSLDTLFVTEKYITKEKSVNIGAKVQAIAPEVLQVFQSRSLADLLTEQTSINIKSMGLGALATASFRGASPAQTRVNWNGVNITPVMAGIFDFSQMPVFFADKVSLVYGSNDVKSGTGAVGGSVNLFSTAIWDGQTEFNLSGEYGSFNTYTAKGSARYGTKNLSMKTRAYFQHSDNDFSYINKVTSNEHFRENRVDSEYSMFSVMQDAHLRITPSSTLTSAIWYQYGDRMLPQPLGVEATSHEKQKEQNLRAYSGWDKYFDDKAQLSLKLAYIFYQLRYDKWYSTTHFDPIGNTNASHTLHVSGDYSHRLSDAILLNTTLTFQHDMAKAESYRDLDPDKYNIDDLEFKIPELEPPVKKYRNILSWHNSIRWQITDKWLTDLRLMLETNDWRKPVFTYSLGFIGSVIPNVLNLRGSVAYNYRFPSLNELYWRPGGNPDVLPERGTSYDATLSLKLPIGKRWELVAEIAPYVMLIDNWILWLPTDESAKGTSSQNQWLWTPQNKRDVLSTGVEAMARLSYSKDDFRGNVSFNYAYTDSHTRTKQHEDDGSLLKQIPYVPKQKWNIRLALDYKQVFVNFQTTYVGVRFITTDQSYFTYPYNVCNLQLGYTFALGDVLLSPQIRVDNLFNTYYESTQYYPMPRRNLLSSIIVKF
ncbi:TonB-dependent receptor plug domain-containing protein [Porphyromonadaceae bacterium W3.11]|nr:TonB-dependent receptor plug domain-containing protein [Porphyromonadaceae bacterium W3.11]